MTTTVQAAAGTARRLGDARQVAALLNISPRHVYRLADAGLMPRPLKLGSCIRWDLDRLAEWVDAGCPSCREGRRP